MLTPLEIFEEWICATKNRYHPIPAGLADPFNLQKDVFKKNEAELQGLMFPSRKIPLYLDYLDDGTCNAYAGMHQNLGLVALNKGAILLPLEIFYKMLSHPEIWKWAGNS